MSGSIEKAGAALIMVKTLSMEVTPAKNAFINVCSFLEYRNIYELALSVSLGEAIAAQRDYTQKVIIKKHVKQ